MAPSRGKGRDRPKAVPPRRSARSRGGHNDIPDVFQSMLAEADVESFPDDVSPPTKRRRIAQEKSPKQALKPAKNEVVSKPRSEASHAKHPQTVEDSSESEVSDFQFEDVDLSQAEKYSSSSEADGIEDLAISIKPEDISQRSRQTNRRKPATFAEKAQRLIVHKLHVLCLLGHIKYLNAWCNNAVVQRHLRPLLTSKTISYLTPKAEFSQFQRNRSFVDGLQQAIDSFTAEFRVTAQGLSKSHWIVEKDADIVGEYAEPMDRSDFIRAAKAMEGSQDTGNQLFCALLRAVGVQTRLVCSLQPLPFGSVPKGATPRKPVRQRVFATASNTDQSASDPEDSAVKGSGSRGKIPSVRRRLGRPAFASKSDAAPVTKREKPVQKLSYPVYWVEAFNKAQQKWLPVDPIVTHTVNKAFKLEPPSSYDLNQLTYAIAVEDTGVARDVTKRYAKAYNAKTRRFRVESSHEGAKWFKKAMRIFRRRGGLLDRDQVEDAELAQKEAREGMPANVLDFKDHPYYALERHLKRNEVIYPMREVGKVNAGTAAKPRMESVYRRQDLLSCKSADKWYRCGREVKEGEQPLKHVAARSRRQRSVDIDDLNGDGPASTTALYAPHQTQLYVPPPVERGRVPRNAYGNLDIYVPSMVPYGGAHVRHRLAKDAARLLKVDYAEAVTGFQFKGRHGTAIVEGIIVAQQFADAVQAVIDGFEDAQVEEESRARSLVALRQWKRFLVGLRIAERVSAYGDGKNDDEKELDDVNVDGVMDDRDIQPGGFFPGAAEDDVLPTAGQFSMGELNAKPKAARQKRRVVDEDSEDDRSLVTDHDTEPTDYGERSAKHTSEHDDDQQGGFFADDTGNQDLGGGFLPDAAGSTHKDETASADHTGPVEDEDGQRGGFIIDGNDEQRSTGGFLPDVDVGNQKSSHSTNANFDHAFEDGQGGGFIVEEDADADGINDNGVSETLGGLSSAGSSRIAPPASSSRPAEKRHGAQVALNGRNNDEAMDENANEAAASRSDADSLPSRDSEDDELEPDWLESD
ncbi:unnamed protein product [Zymoseptoria tritici ST99CH_3D7]|uniref:Rad4 beta-hairpin domain-containing protein n=1 Tax=Zymoseptoria tritici (strain ST99CH_3D7) TaxID=1276538 RepID=A0A1X7RR00_ZYMT9|nr:unnamed protein product [Zymoseptoria tritici ST99CH_3D7]